MSVGIMDADMVQYHMVMFNLEVMKLSAYYRRKRALIVFATSFHPDRHEEFYYRKDYEDGIYPKNLLQEKNVKYGGNAFSNNKYYPLPIEIEKCKPDPTIYERYINFMTCNKKTQKQFQAMLAAEHCRLSLDGKTIWKDYMRQFRSIKNCRTIIFHDYDLGAIQGAANEVKHILSLARTDGWATRIGTKYPIQIHNGEDLLTWSSFKTDADFFCMKYCGFIPNDIFKQWVGKCYEKNLYRQMDYYITIPEYTEEYLTQTLLPQIFRQILISRSYRIFFSLTYDETFFTDKRWIQVIRLMNFYHNSLKIAIPSYLQKIEDDTMYSFAQHSTNDRNALRVYNDFMTKDEIRQTFIFLRTHNYSLFQDFYECSVSSLGRNENGIK